MGRTCPWTARRLGPRGGCARSCRRPGPAQRRIAFGGPRRLGGGRPGLLAQCLMRSNRYGEAASLLAAVHATAEGLGSEPLIRRTDELARVGRGRGTIEEPWRPLTAREFEVARLIARGQTNAEIAAELAIAPKTASAHVEHILAKLGVTRRTEIATWVASISSTNGASTAEPAPVGARR
ncbi:MAG: response regulator transcription factor [Chloroflexi bacterium]|nr:MAG: response regulator transcription factor [Chloroflexota bacterium]